MSVFWKVLQNVFSDLSGFSVCKNKKVPVYQIARLGCTSGEGNGTPLQYFCLENPMDGGAW